MFIINNHSQIILFLKKIVSVALILLIFSCSDNSCVDADDYGEFENQSLNVYATTADTKCKFDVTRAVDDTQVQGAEMLNCLSTIKFKDSNGSEKTGCSTVKDRDDKLSCFNQCYEKCVVDSIKNSLNYEPTWLFTNSPSSGYSPTITLYPDSEIYIDAKGTVTLGEQIFSSAIATDSRSYRYDTHKLSDSSGLTSYNRYFIDLLKDTPIILKFFGTWVDTADTSPDITTTRTLGPGNTSITQPPAGTFVNSSDANLYNGLKRIMVYSIDHPEYYDFKKECSGVIASGSPNSESSCTLGAPILPDPRVWNCSYPSQSSASTAFCTNSLSAPNSYLNFYPNSLLDNFTISNIHQVSNSTKNKNLGKYGGFIRFNDDNLLKPLSFDPFASVSCATSENCYNLNTIDYVFGRFLGDISTDQVITNEFNFPRRIFFKSIINKTQCYFNPPTGNYSISITSDDPKSQYYSSPKVINVPLNTYSSSFVDIDPFSTIRVIKNTTVTDANTNCGNFIVMKLVKLHEIEIEKSGFVRFTQINSTGNCTLNARILNPKALNQEFYEYENFETSTSDPLRNLNVPGSPSYSAMSWSNEVFIRKGQKIRFAPQSWEGTINNANGSSLCGIGMAMQIIPRPALLCKGIGVDLEYNSRCSIDYDAQNNIIGCKAESPNCEDTTQTTKYCPASSNCQYKIINCVNGTDITAKTGCSRSSETKGTCSSYPTGSSSSNCVNCANDQITASREIPKYQVSNVELCYDLEDYTGRVSDIPSSLPTTQIPSNLQSKGLKFIQPFNGSYGSLSPFVETSETNSGNKVYQSRSSMILSKNGRLVFSYLDGEDFTKTSTSSANNSSGLQMQIGNSLTYSNGEWLEIILCKDSGGNCLSTQPNQISDQVPIALHSKPTSNSELQISNYLLGNYKFDSQGMLYRYTTPSAINDCRINSVITSQNSNFYCHTFMSRTQNDLNAMTQSQISERNDEINKVRLAFKIKDPEIADCYTKKDVAGLPYNGTNPPYDGKKILNYNATKAVLQSTPSATDYCDLSTFTGNQECTKKFVCINLYANNSGKYDVNVRIKSNNKKDISKVIGNIIDPVSKIIDGYSSQGVNYPGEAERIYKGIISNSVFKLVTTLAVSIMVMFYGLGYLAGTTELSQHEVITRAIKIGFVYLFTNESGWEWFKFLVVNLFRDGVDYVTFAMASSLSNSTELQTAVSNNDFSNKSLIFSGADNVLNMIFSAQVFKKIAGLLFSGFFGWAYILIFLFSILKYVYAVATALLVYLTAKFFISILFIAGPVFILFTLFNQTRDLFDKWLKYMISFSLQQIMIAMTISFFNTVIYEVIKIALSYRVCWEEVWSFKIGALRISLLSFWTISNLPKTTIIQTGGYDEGSAQYVPSLFSILFIWLLASMMKKMMTYMDELASTMGGGLQASVLGSGLKSAAIQMKNFAKKYAKKAGNFGLKKAGLENITQRLDSALFDSGKIADKKRAEKKGEITRDNLTRSKMKEAGDKAMSDYKRDNAEKFAKMTKEEREKELKQVRDEAMKNKGKELGLADAKVDQMMNKGSNFRTTSDNAFKVAYQLMRNQKNGGGKGLADNKIDTSLSKNDIKSAMKNMDQDQRSKYLNDLKSNSELNKKELGNINDLEKYANRRDKKDQASESKESELGQKLAKMGAGMKDTLSQFKPSNISQQISRGISRANEAMRPSNIANKIASGAKKAGQAIGNAFKRNKPK